MDLFPTEIINHVDNNESYMVTHNNVYKVSYKVDDNSGAYTFKATKVDNSMFPLMSPGRFKFVSELDFNK